MKLAATRLIDDALPIFDYGNRHTRVIATEPEHVWRALERYEFSRDASLVVRALFLLRGLPLRRGNPREVLTAYGFSVLAERPGEEIVVGTTGRFWAIRELGNMEAPRDLDAFRAFDRPGWAKAVMAFRVEARDGCHTKLTTETRVYCVDDAARIRFAPYWRLIRMFSGWIRRDMLRGVARIAEAEA